jgi:hypothetical protein
MRANVLAREGKAYLFVAPSVVPSAEDTCQLIRFFDSWPGSAGFFDY